MAKTTLHETLAGVTLLVASDKRLESHDRRLWITDISKESMNRIVMALAMQAASAMKTAKELSNMQELCDSITQGCELAASELDQLGEYRWTLHCLTN